MTYQTTVIAAVVALILLMVATVLGLGIVGKLDANSSPLIVTVLGAIASTVAALLAVLRSDRAVSVVNETNGQVRSLTQRMEISDPGGNIAKEIYPAVPPIQPAMPDKDELEK